MYSSAKKAISLFLSLTIIFSMSSLLCYASGGKELITHKVIYSDNRHSYTIEGKNEMVSKSSGRNRVKAANIPSSYDSREYGYVTPVKDQGVTGTCWSFSSLSVLESDAIRKGYETADSLDFSESHLVWSSYTASQDPDDRIYGEYSKYEGYTSPYDCGGTIYDVLTDLYKGCGIEDEADFPFYPYDISEMGNYDMSSYYSNNGYTLGNASHLTDTDEIKEWVINHGSIEANIYFSSEYCKESEYADGSYMCNYYCPEEIYANHAVAVVGWDDNYQASNFTHSVTTTVDDVTTTSEVTPSDDGAWLIRNSWSSDWGEDGYFWVSYEDATICNFNGYEISKVDYSNIYTYNGAMLSNFAGYEGKADCANIFTADCNEEIRSVSAIIGWDANVAVNIYKLNPGFTSPEDGTLIYQSASKTYKDGGIRIPVSCDTKLEKGASYSVILRLTSCGSYECQIAVEDIDTNNSENDVANYVNSAGQSYISDGESGWEDLYEDGYGNAYINLYTAADYDNNYVEKTVPANCINDGYTCKECKLCGDRIDIVTIPADGIHTPAEAVAENIVPATASETGSCDSVVYCSVCNAEISRETKTIPVGFISASCDRTEMLRGQKATFTVTTTTDVVWIKLNGSYTTAAGDVKTLGSYYKYNSASNAAAGITVTDEDGIRTWVIPVSLSYTVSDDSVTETWKIDYKLANSSKWYTAMTESGDWTSQLDIYRNASAMPSVVTEYEKYSLVSVDTDKTTASVGDTVTFTVRTTGDVSKVRIGYSYTANGASKTKSVTYQTTSSNVKSITDNGDGTSTWTISYKVPATAVGETDFNVQVRGESWGTAQSKTITVA